MVGREGLEPPQDTSVHLVYSQAQLPLCQRPSNSVNWWRGRTELNRDQRRDSPSCCRYTTPPRGGLGGYRNHDTPVFSRVLYRSELRVQSVLGELQRV